jgi:uncharacterized protein YggE
VPLALFAALSAVTAARAQEAPPPAAPLRTAPLPGITVVGRATERVPADFLRFDVQLTAPQTGGNLDEVGKSVADTLRKNGIPDAVWLLPITGYIGSSTPGSVVGSVAKPTREGVEALARRIAQALPDSMPAGVRSVQILASLVVENCRPLEARAQQDVVADARQRAQEIATAAGLTLGAITSVSEAQASPLSACHSKSDPIMPGARDLTAVGPLDVTIGVTATVTFSVRPSP